jgi:hypothetical protein
VAFGEQNPGFTDDEWHSCGPLVSDGLSYAEEIFVIFHTRCTLLAINIFLTFEVCLAYRSEAEVRLAVT